MDWCVFISAVAGFLTSNRGLDSEFLTSFLLRRKARSEFALIWSSIEELRSPGGMVGNEA
jgi:hypothetical protein